MDSRQAGNGGRLLTQQVLPTAVVCELPVQRKLVEWQLGKQPAGVLGGWQSLPGSASASRVSSFVCVCGCVCVCVFVGRGWIAGRV